MKIILATTSLLTLLTAIILITLSHSYCINKKNIQESYFLHLKLIEWRDYLDNFNFTKNNALAEFSDSNYFQSIYKNWSQESDYLKFNHLKPTYQDDGNSIKEWKISARINITEKINSTLESIKKDTRNNDKRLSLITISLIAFILLWSLSLLIFCKNRNKKLLKEITSTNEKLEKKQINILQRNKIMSSILEDLTDERKRSNFSRVNDQRLALVAKYSDDCLIGLNADSNISSWNPKAEALFSKPESTMLDKPLHILFDESDSNSIKNAITDITIHKPHTTKTVKWISTKKNQLQYLDISITGLFYQKEIEGYSVIIRDVSSKIQEIEQLRLLIEATPNTIIMSDINGHIIQANDYAEKTFFYEKYELLSLKIEDLITEASTLYHKNLHDNCLHSSKIKRIGASKALTARRKDNTTIYVEVGLAPVEIEGKHFIISAVTDISERIEAQNKLKIFNKSLSQKNKEMEQFVYTVSHDLKAPLVTISAFSQSIKKMLQNSDNPKILRKLDRVIANANIMEELITDLLEISRIVNRPLATNHFSIDLMIRDVLETLEESLNHCLIRTHVNPPDIQLLANRALIMQCIQNIIINAAKYSDKQSPEIDITAIQDNNNIYISIKDNGLGIAPEYQDRIFDIFERGDTTISGNGVGLAIVKSVIQKHQGSITLESKINNGATFTLSIPRAKSTSLTSSQVDFGEQ
ncbi:PAS domain-containing sensor histidine kinase [Marinagarivorans algicola]|uniref:PAS domain-containing sensor histidine kinase n=1 Tax=Marinagarivorans algicola TaxID=1513270 RepID=UPI0037369C83